jgi:hypothetical protein
MWKIEHNGIGTIMRNQQELASVVRIMREWKISCIVKKVEFTLKGKIEQITGMYDGK